MISVRAIAMLLAMAAAFVCRPADGTVDDFQCTCSYNTWDNVHRIRLMLANGAWDTVEFASRYGTLVSRMLFVAHSLPNPTARWLWELNLLTNTVQQLFEPPSANTVFSHANQVKMMASSLDRVSADLDAYMKICWGRRRVVNVGMSQEVFEKYVLENMTSIVQKPDYREDRGGGGGLHINNYEPRCFYLNDLPANGTEALDKILTQDVGIDWHVTASKLSHMYNLSKRNWLLGTQELVLYQRTFMSTVVASMMGYVLVHVTYCQEHWLANFSGAETASDTFVVGEYERVWMSITSLLEKFKQYLDLGRDAYFKMLMDVAANPVWDSDKFEMVKYAIKTSINNVGAGVFSLETVKVNRIGDIDKSSEKSVIALIALVDNNISAAEKYLKVLQQSLLDVNFVVIRDFMRSTHFWLT